MAVYWRMFGSNGHQKRPEGLVISNYTRTAEKPDPHIKSVVNPRRILRAKPSTHYWLYKHEQWAVDERFRPIKTSHGTEGVNEVLRINHYWSKSREDGVAKFARGYIDRWGMENPRTMDKWREMDSTMNAVEDTLILRYEAELQARLAARRMSLSEPRTTAEAASRIPLFPARSQANS